MLLSHGSLGWKLKSSLYIITGVIAAFLALPIFFIMALSFGSSQWLVFPPPSWTLKWYERFFDNSQWIESAITSLQVASLTSIIATLLAIPASFALVRGQFRGRDYLYTFFTLPMVVPVVIIAVAVYGTFLNLGLTGTLFAFVASHVIIALPFAIISIINSLRLFDKSIEDAAVICGAHRIQAIIKVTFPAIKPGVISAALFSFLVSWDEVVISVMMASPNLQTLPVKMWSTLRQDLTPVIAVASTLLILLSLLIMIIASFVRKQSNHH
ncbi:ABC transporter permease [Marinomonas foliarum]|uniref:Putative spermidine/putrescine transport system permease protein n=1 Tax=Marinomonas foliarum TaxID=491950 RepID=A0A368ZRJ2_9GAMM|nr:ABC transporter permease [Marinomonas foliarum]RCW99634.1 putative spermidine/putrescine transport system permease protein [Marinomonas foliarum]